MWPEMDYELGDPEGPAKETSTSPITHHSTFTLTHSLTHPHPSAPGSQIWGRNFSSGAWVVWDNRHKTGRLSFPGHPPPPPPPPPHNITCGAKKSTFLTDYTFGSDDVDRKVTSSAQDCCIFCVQTKHCVEWAWHSEQKRCHAHGKRSNGPNPMTGVISGVLW